MEVRPALESVIVPSVGTKEGNRLLQTPHRSNCPAILACTKRKEGQAGRADFALSDEYPTARLASQFGVNQSVQSVSQWYPRAEAEVEAEAEAEAGSSASDAGRSGHEQTEVRHSPILTSKKATLHYTGPARLGLDWMRVAILQYIAG
jgi:hypothetical protein